MNFDFSQEQELLRDQARRFLADRGATARCRQALESGGGFDGQLWREMAELGWLGAALPEQYGGAGLSYVDLCVIAEELGRANAATTVLFFGLSRERSLGTFRHRGAKAAMAAEASFG